MDQIASAILAIIFWPVCYLTASWLLPILSLGILRVLPVGSSQTRSASWSFTRLSTFRIGVGPSLACIIGLAIWVLIGTAFTKYVIVPSITGEQVSRTTR